MSGGGGGLGVISILYLWDEIDKKHVILGNGNQTFFSFFLFFSFLFSSNFDTKKMRRIPRYEQPNPFCHSEKPVDVLVGVVIAYYYGKQDFRGL